MSSMPDIMLIDPTFLGGILTVPFAKTFETKGRSDWLRGVLRKELSLCCLYQNGKCHAGSKCFQVHADRAFVAELRQHLAHVKSCCEHCGDTATLAASGAAVFARLRASGIDRVTVAGATLPLGMAAVTTGFLNVVQSAPAGSRFVEIPAQRVCRLHLKSRCKYGKDCKNVHLCSRLGESILNGHIPPGLTLNQAHDRLVNTAPESLGLMSPPLSPGLSFSTSPSTPQPIALENGVPVFRTLDPSAACTPAVDSSSSPASIHSFGDELDDDKTLGVVDFSSMNFDVSKCTFDDSFLKFTDAAATETFLCPCSASLMHEQFW